MTVAVAGSSASGGMTVVRSSKHSLHWPSTNFNFYAVGGFETISLSRLSSSLSRIFLLEFKNNFLDDLLTDISFVHNFNHLIQRHGKDDSPNNSGSKLYVYGLNLREDLVSQVLALRLFVSKLLKTLE